MKTSKTQLVSATFTFTLNPELSKLQNFKNAAEAGFPAGKTSFMNLVNGVVKEVKGVKLVTVTEKPESSKAKAKKSVAKVKKTSQRVQYAVASQARKMLEDLGLEVKVVEAARKTYGTLKTPVGRVQLDPKVDGTFGVWVYPAKGYDTKDAQTLLENVKVANVKCASQHVKATLVGDQVRQLAS